MDCEHKIIREKLKQLTKPGAEKLLKELLPEREYKAVYFCDIEDWPRWKVGREKTYCEPPQVSRIKGRAYDKLKSALDGRTL